MVCRHLVFAITSENSTRFDFSPSFELLILQLCCEIARGEEVAIKHPVQFTFFFKKHHFLEVLCVQVVHKLSTNESSILSQMADRHDLTLKTVHSTALRCSGE